MPENDIESPHRLGMMESPAEAAVGSVFPKISQEEKTPPRAPRWRAASTGSTPPNYTAQESRRLPWRLR
jgi:hypothetical protein